MADEPQPSTSREPSASHRSTTRQNVSLEEAVRRVTEGAASDLESLDSLDAQDSEDGSEIHGDDVIVRRERALTDFDSDSESELGRATDDPDDPTFTADTESDGDTDGDVPVVQVSGRKRARVSGRASVRGRGRGVGTRGRVPAARRGRGRGRGRSTGTARFDGQFVDTGDYTPAQLEFTGDSGIKVPTDNFQPIDYYKLFLTDELLNGLVQNTNLYATQTIAEASQNEGGLSRSSRLKQWTDTNTQEIQQWLGLTLLTGLVRKPTIAMYWTHSSIFSTPVFGAVMTRNRYQLLLRMLHFCDNTQMPAQNDPNRDRLFKIRQLVTILQERFQTVYKPGRNVAVDESLMLWKGALIFRQYLPLKRARFGVKTFYLCEDSGYTFRFHIYTGKTITDLLCFLLCIII